MALQLTCNINRQALARVLVHDREISKVSSIVCSRCHKVIRPHIIRTLQTKANATCIVKPESSAFLMFHRHFQSLLSPDSLHALVIYPPTNVFQHRRNCSIFLASVRTSELNDVLCQCICIVARNGAVSLHAARLTECCACPSLQDAKMVDRAGQPPRAYKFWLVASRKIAMSSV